MMFQRPIRSLWLTRIAGIILSIAISPVVTARSLDINMSDDTAQFRFITPVGFQNSFGSAEIDLGFLSTTTDDVMGVIGFQAVDEAGSATPGLRVGVGLKVFAGKINENNVNAVALGGEARIPVFNRVNVFVDAHFAPDVVTFGDTVRLLSFNTRLEYELLPQATVYLGYRKIRSNLEAGGKVSIDNGGHIGLQFSF